MQLDEIRNEINKIDDKMDTLFQERMKCSGQVAKTKMQTGDSVYKPKREKQVLARFSDEENMLNGLHVRKVMQLSRYYQYEQFLKETDISDEMFCAVWEGIFQTQKEVSLCVELVTDETLENGMSVQDILSVLGDFATSLESLFFKENRITISLFVPVDTQSRWKVKCLTYMLYKESLQCRFQII